MMTVAATPGPFRGSSCPCRDPSWPFGPHITFCCSLMPLELKVWKRPLVAQDIPAASLVCFQASNDVQCKKEKLESIQLHRFRMKGHYAVLCE